MEAGRRNAMVGARVTVAMRQGSDLSDRQASERARLAVAENHRLEVGLIAAAGHVGPGDFSGVEGLYGRQAMTNTNLAGRAGRWSAAHWKRAAFGWILFAVLAVFMGAA